MTSRSPARPSLSPFQTPVGAVARSPAVTIPLERSVGDASRLMRDRRVGSLVVLDGGRPIGIVTESDLARRALAEGLGAEADLGPIVSRPLAGIDAERPLFEALMTMLRGGFGHLAVYRSGELAGMVSERDWLRVQERHPAALFHEMAHAETVERLAALRQEALRLARGLIGDDGPASALTALLTETNDRVTRRVIALALRESAGAPPARFAWIALGSEGRGEQTLATDQDNGLIFEDLPAHESDRARRWFLALAERAVSGLERCGFARCKGNVMASNPELCRPLEGWKAMFGGMLADPDPGALLEASICFDLRAIEGDAALAAALWEWLLERIARNQGFLNHLAGSLGTTVLPVSSPWWRLRVAMGWGPDVFDVKRSALHPLVHGLRVLALRHGISASGSLTRLQALREAGALAEATASEIRRAWEFFTGLRLRHQFAQAAGGAPPDNAIALAALDPLQRRFLVDALKTVRAFQLDVVSAHGDFGIG